ncbi:MAG: sulfite exporter TauE/SafE family protein [Alphaproteobacteria bacterium]
MQLYLPIAEMTISADLIFAVSAFVGFLSGVFGIGGGFLTTPFLIFSGIPPAVAVGTQASQLVASSVSGAIGHWQRGNVDIKMGLVMLGGGLLGSFVGIFIFKLLQYLGQIDFAVSLIYVILLGSIGSMMLFESVFSRFFKKKTVRREFNTMKTSAVLAMLPYKMRFPRSKLYISALVPGGIGFVGGILASVLGIGGGFLLVPAMIYLLGMPTLLVAGTSLFQIIFTTAAATIMHAVFNHTVDAVLAVVLIVGGVFGAQVGLSAARFVRQDHARLILAILVLLVCFQLCFSLFMEPGELFSTVVWSV